VKKDIKIREVMGRTHKNEKRVIKECCAGKCRDYKSQPAASGQPTTSPRKEGFRFDDL
jgi:hypothetical protein